MRDSRAPAQTGRATRHRGGQKRLVGGSRRQALKLAAGWLKESSTTILPPMRRRLLPPSLGFSRARRRREDAVRVANGTRHQRCSLARSERSLALRTRSPNWKDRRRHPIDGPATSRGVWHVLQGETPSQSRIGLQDLGCRSVRMHGSSPARTTVRFVGRYALYEEIASGGMATVHLGRLLGPVGFQKTVAIKRLHEMYAREPEFVSMFVNEAKLAARIQHPNVVSTIDVVATSTELFLVMEYVAGEALSRLLRRASERGERCPPAVAAAIACNMLHGLHAAHETT